MSSLLGGWNAVASVLATIFAFCAYGIYAMDMKYGEVGLETVLSSGFLSMDQLALVRIICGLCVWSTCLHMLFDPTGLTIQVITPHGRAKALRLQGIQRFTAFTQWSWAMQGWYFGLCTILWLLKKYYPMVLLDSSYGLAPFLPRLCHALWMMYELSVTMSFMVSSVVTFVLIPQARKKGLPIDNYYRPLTLAMHNLNVLFMTIELGVNSFRFCWTHIFVTTIWGFLYILFAWWWYKKMGVFFYFFLDYHNKVAVLFHLGLLSLMSCFYGMCAFVANYVQNKSSGDDAQYWPFYTLLCLSIFIMKWPAGEEWSIVTNAMRDTWNGIPYKQKAPDKKGMAAALAAATLKDPKKKKEQQEEVAPEPTRRSARSRSKSGAKGSDDKAKGRSRSRSRSKGRR